MRPYFSIIIPTLNEEIDLPILLRSLDAQIDRDFEIIVCDSGSVDKTRSEAEKYKNRFADFKFIIHKVKNVSMARNFGARLARGEYLIFFDADVEIASDFIALIKNHIASGRLDALTVWNRTKKKCLSGKLVLMILNANMTLFQKIKPAANGPCIIIRRALFEKVKGFDETIVFGEDFDLIQRAHKPKMRFMVFQKPVLYVSTRRFEKEGFFFSLYKSIKALVYQLITGPIRKPIFDYKMGGQYYKKNS